MYYSSGNYEAFVRPRKPEGADRKSAYIIGSGLAALSAAAFLVRDAYVDGSRIHIIEKDSVLGGACDGWNYEGLGYVMRGGREMDNHFECMWDLYRSIPSIENEGMSVLDEYYYLNKDDPNYSLMRATMNRGEDGRTNRMFGLSDKAQLEIMKLFFTPDEALYDLTIEDVFSDEVLDSNFWLYWRTMFAFENWHSALEMKIYIRRYIHHVEGLPDFSALRFTKYNQYESMILPLQGYLEAHGVDIITGTKVTDVRFDVSGGRKRAVSITVQDGEGERMIPLSDDDLLFITPGGCVENSALGSQDKAAPYHPELKAGGGWDLWKRIAAQSDDFGHPEKFCSDPEKTSWMSATVTLSDDSAVPYIEGITKRNPYSGKVVTGGIVTAKDSSWLLSWTFNRQPQFREQKANELVGWIYGLFPFAEGDYVKKPMSECTGREIAMEWLYHIGVPLSDIPRIAEESCNTIPCMMPYITAFFMPRSLGDRPYVVPEDAVNFAFIGQFAETERDTIFTTEYSIRTAMEAVYTLMDVDRGVPEVWGSAFDVRDLVHASVALRDGRKLTEMDMGLKEKLAMKEALKRIQDSDIEKLLKAYGAI